MSSPISASRLPDLPNAGYSTERQKATSDLVMFWLRNIERDRLLLLSIVIDGPAKWRKTAGNAWGLSSAGRASAVTTELLDRVFQYMALLAGPNPAEQLLILMGQLNELEKARWDKRQRTRKERQKALTGAMNDLRKYGSSETGSQ